MNDETAKKVLGDIARDPAHVYPLTIGEMKTAMRFALQAINDRAELVEELSETMPLPAGMCPGRLDVMLDTARLHIQGGK
jgi:hypothetical protein